MNRYVKKGLPYLVEGFLLSIQAEGKAPRTYEYYSKLLQHFLQYATDERWNSDINHLNTEQIREFLSYVASRTYEHSAGNGARIVRQSKPTAAWPYFRALRRLFNWATEEGLIEESPLAKIHFKPPNVAPIEPYSQSDLKKLLAQCDLDVRNGSRFTGLRNRAMLLLFLDSGIRKAEMTGLKLRQLDLKEKRLTVIGKGNKVGIVPFCSKTAKAIWFYLAEREARAKCDYLWITEEGNALSIDGIDSWFNRLKKRAGVTTPGCLHKLRHTAALQYLRGAHDSFLLQLFLRHESLEMSRRYTQGLKAEEAIIAHRNGASPVEQLGLS
ncbi:tyrosine-type recombinase/integrase [Chloroflexota bacterium]